MLGDMTTAADSNRVQGNYSLNNGRDGIRAAMTTVENTIQDNLMQGNVEHDCHDDSVGPYPGMVANHWIDDQGNTENRPGLCEKAERHDDDDRGEHHKHHGPEPERGDNGEDD